MLFTGLLAFSYDTNPFLFGVVIFVAALAFYLVAIFLFKTILAKKSKAVKNIVTQDEQVDEIKNPPLDDTRKAPGRSGEILLKNVTEREAAMIMAIVADKLDTPINELSFKSITRNDNEV